MTIVAICSANDVANVNATLNSLGFGDKNFSILAFSGGARASMAILHSWDFAPFQDALESIPAVEVSILTDVDPSQGVSSLAEGAGAVYVGGRPTLPETGVVSAGDYYLFQRSGDFECWRVIQQHDRGVFGGDPNQYPALIRQARIPGQVAQWVQPLDQFDAYLTIDPFTGQGERVSHNGSTWLCTSGSAGGPNGSLLNTWEPGVFGWTQI